MDKPLSFLDFLYDPGHKDRWIKWKFYIIDGRVETGKVIDHKNDGRAQPITLMIDDLCGNIFEIPWSSIQTISFVHEWTEPTPTKVVNDGKH